MQVLSPRADKLLAGLDSFLPHKKAILRAVPIKGIVCLGGSFWDLFRPHEFVTLKGMPLPLQHIVVHSCLQLRLIRHEWDASFFDVGASLKNCSHRLQRTNLHRSLTLEQTNCMRAWIHSSPTISYVISITNREHLFFSYD